MTLISKGEIDYGRLNISIVVFILMILGANGLYNWTFNNAYLQIEFLGILVIYLAVAFHFCIKGLKELRTIDIYTEKIAFRYIGVRLQTIPFSRITGYSTFIDENSHFIKFTTGKRVYLINRNLLSNEDELMTSFKLLKDKRDQQLNAVEYRKIKNRETLLMGLFGLILLLLSILYFIFKPHSVTRDLVPITGTLKENFEIHKPSKSPARFITFKTNQNNEFEFRIGPGYDKIDLSQLENYKPNDTLRLLIAKEDFLTKIEKSKAPSFMKAHFKWKDIYVYQLHANNNKILSANDYYAEASKNEKSDKIWAPILGIVGFVILRHARKDYR